MSVRKRVLASGAIRWQIDYRDLSGIRRAKQFETKKEATDYQIKSGSEIKAGTHVANSASITVQQAGEFWLQRAKMEGLEAGTIRQYRAAS